MQAFFWGSPALPEICDVYEKALVAELDRVLAAIPHADLGVQWDIAVEFHRVWEKPNSDLAKQFSTPVLIETIARLSDHIPTEAELGWHFCYGDAGHKHFVEPRDTELMVTIANKLTAATQREAQWLHLPVPRDRSDQAYFKPLAGLKLNPATELYLGLIHLTDGVPGAQRRIAAADTVVSRYGVATECGFGRRPPGYDPVAAGPASRRRNAAELIKMRPAALPPRANPAVRSWIASPDRPTRRSYR